MSALSKFIHTAREILDEHDRKAAPKAQPPFFTRTTWLFVELEELSEPNEVEIFLSLKVARLSGDIAGAGRIIDHVHAASAPLEAVQRHQRQQICGWIKQQIEREQKT